MKMNLASHPLARAALPALCVLAAVAVYLSSLANGFALDDVHIIQQNARVHQLSDLSAIWLKPYWPFFGVQLGLWRPLAIFVYALQWAAGGGSALPFHVVSILLHALVTLLVFLLIERLTTRTAACVGALLFAVHPVHTEAVANIVGQAELITGAAMIGACLLHATRPAGMDVSWPRRIALAAIFALGILTKEHAVVMPALLVAVDLAQKRVPLTRRGVIAYIDAMLMPILLMICVLLAYLTTRYIVLEGALLGVQAGPQFHYLREEYRIFNAFRAYPELLRLLVSPFDLSADYAPAMILPVESLTPMTIVGAIMVLATIALALITPWKPAAGLPAAWFFISIITVSNLVFPIGVLIAERTLYVPSLALSIAVAYAWMLLGPRLSRAARRLAPVLLIAVLAAYSWRTWTRNPDWRDTQTVLLSVARDHPESYKAQWTLAAHMWQIDNVPAARDHFELSYRLYNRDTQALTEYANFLIHQGELERPLELLERSYSIHPFVPRTVFVLGDAYIRARRFEDALALARRAERDRVDHSVTMPIRAAAYEGMGDTLAALGAWRWIIRQGALAPQSAWADLAVNLARLGLEQDALNATARGFAAGGDTAVVARLGRIREAIAAGCVTDPGERPECAVLREQPAGTPQVQNATALQNATAPQ